VPPPELTGSGIALRRLYSNRLLGTRFEQPEDVVRWLGAVQAQDYAGAKWAIGQRSTGATDADLDKLFSQGAILRTHLLRPTWHFVVPTDIRWMLKLTRPRVNTANTHMYRQLELDAALFTRSHAVLQRTLAGGARLTRPEIASALSAAGIEASALRLAYIVMRAELDGLVCSGGLRGKQFTYALLDERVPTGRTLDHDEALAELASRYFTSHGPAQVQDYTKWSGLTGAAATAGIETVTPRLLEETVEGKRYFFAPGPRPARLKTPVVHLLPNYDEHVNAYRDYSASFDPGRLKTRPDSSALIAHIVVLDGQVIGGWRRTISRTGIAITTHLLVELAEVEQAALAAAAADYGRFMGKPVSLESKTPA
jgi:hypothetical protein